MTNKMRMPVQGKPEPDPVGAQGAQLKRQINDAKKHKKTEPFDPGASMLGTDNEAGDQPDHGGMAEARQAPKP